jgi:DedD protein
MAESSDAQLQLKKRARRRLVGAIAFAGLAAIVLPMVMDEEPKQQVQDVQIRIPGQDQTPFNPKALAAKPPVALSSAEKPVLPVKPDVVQVEKTPEKSPEKATEKKVEKPVEKSAEKAVAKPPEKLAEKPASTPPAKAAKAPVEETQRAAAILGGKPAEAPPASGGGQYLILIGAFANAANVKQLQSKIGELGIKTFTEPLDSPQGKKTRVRAGPFPNREAADKALDRMKRIGVSGVVAAK